MKKDSIYKIAKVAIEDILKKGILRADMETNEGSSPVSTSWADTAVTHQKDTGPEQQALSLSYGNGGIAHCW